MFFSIVFRFLMRFFKVDKNLTYPQVEVVDKKALHAPVRSMWITQHAPTRVFSGPITRIRACLIYRNVVAPLTCTFNTTPVVAALVPSQN